MYGRRGMGEATIYDLPLGESAAGSAAAVAAYYAAMPQADLTGVQFCPVGVFSDDPLIPGVCNTSVLAGAAVLFLLFWLMRSFK